jgi:hypothetical protein
MISIFFTRESEFSMGTPKSSIAKSVALKDY